MTLSNATAVLLDYIPLILSRARLLENICVHSLTVLSYSMNIYNDSNYGLYTYYITYSYTFLLRIFFKNLPTINNKQ